jgi:hypothetical protein
MRIAAPPGMDWRNGLLAPREMGLVSHAIGCRNLEETLIGIRLNVSLNGGASSLAIQEMELRTSYGGGSILIGGTASASNYDGVNGYVPANAFDGSWGSSASTRWQTQSGVTTGQLIYALSAPVDISAVREIFIYPINAGSGVTSQYPKSFALEYSKDGVNWTAFKSLSNYTSLRLLRQHVMRVGPEQDWMQWDDIWADYPGAFEATRGNLRLDHKGTADKAAARATFARDSGGKIGWEMYVEDRGISSLYLSMGWADSAWPVNSSRVGSTSGSWGYMSIPSRSLRLKNHNGTIATFGRGFGAGDWVGTSWDTSTGEIEFYDTAGSCGVAFTGVTGVSLYPALASEGDGGGTGIFWGNFRGPWNVLPGDVAPVDNIT